MSTPKTYGLTHLAIAVKDVERTKLFYETVFDMQAMYHQEGFVQLTAPGCNNILVFEEKNGNKVGKKGGIEHFGFRLKNPKDLDNMVKRIVKAGGTVTGRGEFVAGEPYVFFQDPDGYEVEVWYELLK